MRQFLSGGSVSGHGARPHQREAIERLLAGLHHFLRLAHGRGGVAGGHIDSGQFGVRAAERRIHFDRLLAPPDRLGITARQVVDLAGIAENRQ